LTRCKKSDMLMQAHVFIGQISLGTLVQIKSSLFERKREKD